MVADAVRAQGYIETAFPENYNSIETLVNIYIFYVSQFHPIKTSEPESKTRGDKMQDILSAPSTLKGP